MGIFANLLGEISTMYWANFCESIGAIIANVLDVFCQCIGRIIAKVFFGQLLKIREVAQF
jgi:hypothetical protein